MRTSVVGLILFAFTAPVQASEFRSSDRRWVKTVDEYGELFGKCFFGTPDMQEDGNGVPQAPVCKAMDKLEKKLQANGYCLVGRAIVGRPSKDRKHCYTIDWPALTVPAHAAPAQKWFMTVNIYNHANHGYTDWDSPEIFHLKRAFDTRSECIARWRSFRKQCSGLIADTRQAGAGLTKFTGFCRRHPQQPEPVFTRPTLEELPKYFIESESDREGFQKELECTK